jgi:hypothetical protein
MTVTYYTVDITDTYGRPWYGSVEWEKPGIGGRVGLFHWTLANKQTGDGWYSKISYSTPKLAMAALRRAAKSYLDVRPGKSVRTKYAAS